MEFVCFIWISEQTANFALHNIKRWVFITEVESVYCAVRTVFFIRQIRFIFKRLISVCAIRLLFPYLEMNWLWGIYVVGFKESDK